MPRALLDFQLFIFFKSLQSRTNSDIGLHLVAYPVKITLIFRAALAPNPGDATANLSVTFSGGVVL